MKKIDFVILWVDGKDPIWLNEKNKYSQNKKGVAYEKSRYRDWDNLQYWFRGVEKYASWVNKIFFVTFGHVPRWLNKDNEKLIVVKHSDFIPLEYLPTFNSNTILLNLHNIKGLSDNFVVFNDDMFLLKHVKEEDFFKNEIPRDECVHNVITSYGVKGQHCHFLLNNIDIINRYFKKYNVMQKNFFKTFNFKYGIKLLRTAFLLPWYSFTGFYDPHIPNSYLKKTYIEVWDKEGEVLKNTCTHKFRNNEDVTEWVMRYWQLCKGEFIPRKNKTFGKYYNITNDNRDIVQEIVKQKHNVICINDVRDNFDFEKAKNEIIQAFEEILPEKSSFEK